MIKIPTIPARYIKKISIQGLSGRALELPDTAPKARTPLLLIYGHHSSLERMYSIAQGFNDYGPVVVPDLPGFGGMPALGTIGKAPTVDNLADYLAGYIRMRFPNGQRFILEGMSLGFVVATRMLQRHPELAKQITHFVSLVGFVNADDFAATPRRRRLFARTARALAAKATSSTFRRLFLQKPVIALTYHLRARSHPKMKGYNWQERQRLITFEVTLWKSNEVRTYFSTLAEMLSLDLTKQKIALPVEHVAVLSDQYFDNEKVVEDMKKIFTSVRMHTAELPNHVPTVLEEVADARHLIPATLTKVFASKG